MTKPNILFVWRCTFCNRLSGQVDWLVTLGQGAPAICNDCIKDAQQVIDLKEEELRMAREAGK